MRRELGIAPGDRVGFLMRDGRILLSPLRSTLDELQGIFKPLRPMSEDFDEEIEEAMEERAQELFARLNER
jgi:bifunctional DNA-binding transcriptional regulator/antitoxin component of YhaV-PrlF toxin-antitoxin module